MLSPEGGNVRTEEKERRTKDEKRRKQKRERGAARGRERMSRVERRKGTNEQK
jgi:hypothetical protein